MGPKRPSFVTIVQASNIAKLILPHREVVGLNEFVHQLRLTPNPELTLH